MKMIYHSVIARNIMSKYYNLIQLKYYLFGTDIFLWKIVKINANTRCFSIANNFKLIYKISANYCCTFFRSIYKLKCFLCSVCKTFEYYYSNTIIKCLFRIVGSHIN